MHLVKRIGKTHNFRSRAILERFRAIHKLVEIIEISCAFVLVGEVVHKLNIALRTKHPFFLEHKLLEVDPQQLVVDAKPVQELGDLYVILLILERDHVPSQLSQELLESRRIQVFFFKESSISNEDIEGQGDMVLIKAFLEHVLHEKVNFIHRVEFLELVSFSFRSNSREVTVSSLLNILVLNDFTDGSLLPPVFYVPVQLSLSSLFNFLLVFCSSTATLVLTKL